MGEGESSGSGTEQDLAYFEKYPIVARMLIQNTSFRREVENFYDILPLEIAIFREFKLGEESPQKKGKYPTDLIEVLDAISEEPFDRDKLRYDSVREDYQRWNAASRRTKRAICFLGGMLAGCGGIAACIYSAVEGNSGSAVPAGVVGAGGLILYFKTGLYSPPKGTNYELDEYLRLHKSAKRADRLMGLQDTTNSTKISLSTR